jgi:hypothetical protein
MSCVVVSQGLRVVGMIRESAESCGAARMGSMWKFTGLQASSQTRVQNPTRRVAQHRCGVSAEPAVSLLTIHRSLG